MDRFGFELDWLAGEGIQGPELAATYARFQIRIGDEVLTRVFDRGTNAVRDYLLVPLYPLAEWLASNWWCLRYESENPASRGRQPFRERHSLRMGREGYTLPDLEVVSWGACTRIVSTTDPMPRPNGELVHLRQTIMWVSTCELFETIADLIDQVLRRLASLGVTGTALEEDWAAVRSADDNDTRFCRAAARLGWVPYAIDDRQRDQVLVLAERLGAVFDDAAPVLDPSDTRGGLARERGHARKGQGQRPSPSMPRDGAEGTRPRAARQPRTRAGGERACGTAPPGARRSPEPVRTWEDLACMLDEDPKVLEAVLRPAGQLATLPFVDAVVTATGDGLPGLAFRESSARALRPSFCRALAELVAAPGTNALVTKAMTDRQERSHAFAGELLALASWLAERIAGPAADHGSVEKLATELDIAPRVVADEIITHRIARVRPYGWGSRYR